MRGVVSGLTAIILAVACGVMVPAGPSLAEVNCSSLDLQVELPGMPEYCDTGDSRGVGWTATWEEVSVTGNTVMALIHSSRAGHRTYIMRESVRELLDRDAWFAESREWSEAYKIGDYQVQNFDGAWTSNGAFWSCAGFVYYARRVTGSTGYRNQVIGAYCVPERQEVDEEDLTRLIDSIRY